MRLRDLGHRFARSENRSAQSQCYRCGLLGGYRHPNASTALPDLEEILVRTRSYWKSRLGDARKRGLIQGSEFDSVRGQEIGRDDSYDGFVCCGIGAPQGPGSSFVWRGDDDHFFEQPRGVLIWAPGSDKRMGLGGVIGAVSTDLWALVRHHSCPHLLEHCPGLSPAQHVEKRERRATESKLSQSSSVSLEAP
jgi:hypothetical protein